MHPTIKRALFYMALTGAALFIGAVFTESRGAFVAVLVFALAVGLVGEVLFWSHVLRIPFDRRRRREGTD